MKVMQMFSAIQNIDDSVLKITGRIAGQSEFFDKIEMHLLGLPSIKIMPIVLCLWVIWFSHRDVLKAKLSIYMAAGSAVLAMVVARIVQDLGPGRPRPLFSGNPNYVAPIGVDRNALADFSSFPSDHAALAFSLSSAVFYFSRPLGIFCYLWSFFIVSLMRVYAGYHYLSDVVGGALIGVFSFGLIYLVKGVFKRLQIYGSFIEEKYTGPFYAIAFLLCFQIVTMFNDMRVVAAALAKHLGH